MGPTAKEASRNNAAAATTEPVYSNIGTEFTTTHAPVPLSVSADIDEWALVHSGPTTHDSFTECWEALGHGLSSEPMAQQDVESPIDLSRDDPRRGDDLRPRPSTKKSKKKAPD